MRIGRHLHATFFDYHDHGTTLTPTVRMIDMVMQCQGAHRPRVFGLPGTEARRLMSRLPSGKGVPRLILLVIPPKQEHRAAPNVWSSGRSWAFCARKSTRLNSSH